MIMSKGNYIKAGSTFRISNESFDGDDFLGGGVFEMTSGACDDTLVGGFYCEMDQEKIDEILDNLNKYGFAYCVSGGNGSIKLIKSSDVKQIVLNTENQKEEPSTKTPWVGEGYPPIGCVCEVSIHGQEWRTSVVKYISEEVLVILTNGAEECYSIEYVKFRPLETPEQKKEREELEAAYDLYKTRYQTCTLSFDVFKKGQDRIEGWVEVVRKTNYKIK